MLAGVAAVVLSVSGLSTGRTHSAALALQTTSVQSPWALRLRGPSAQGHGAKPYPAPEAKVTPWVSGGVVAAAASVTAIPEALAADVSQVDNTGGAWAGLVQGVQAHPMLCGALPVLALVVLLARWARPSPDIRSLRQHAAQGVVAAAASAGLLCGGPVDGPALTSFSPAAAYAASDDAQIGQCVLARCQAQLAGCLSDPRCVENLICIKSCSGRDDEAACQVSFMVSLPFAYRPLP